MKLPTQFEVGEPAAGQTLAAVIRQQRPDLSWSQVKRLIDGRQVKLNAELCRDPARRLKLGDVLQLLPSPEKPQLAPAQQIVLRHVDEHVVVVEKPAGMNTVRHPAELEWTKERKALSPTLHDLVPAAINHAAGRDAHAQMQRIRIVHRLDKETSGLVVFARSVPAERSLGKQFFAHTVTRRYLALVGGDCRPGRFESWLVRDRGDGRRGSAKEAGDGKMAVTHVEVAERLPGFTLVTCRLETGRTHQIRIHLSEAGHPVCGDKVYGIRTGDGSRAQRLALHATELGFVHPTTGEALHWQMPLPADLQSVLARVRAGGTL